MQLYTVVKSLEQIALTSPYIRSTGEGSVYTIMNENPHTRYAKFVISQLPHTQDEYFDYFNFNIFVIDRLCDDLESNRLQIQSVAKDVIYNTILTFERDFYGVTHTELRTTVFTEKFVDLCAGAYSQVTLKIPKNIICPDNYEETFVPNYRLQQLVVTVDENGLYEYEPEEGWDGWDKVIFTVQVNQSGHTDEELREKYYSGMTYQKTLLVATAFTENGVYERENGYSSVTVDVPPLDNWDSGYTSGYTDGTTDGYRDGEEHQKSLLSAITITHNGEYLKDDGYSAITVDVPQTGVSINNQTKTITITDNTATTISYDDGFTGLESVIINTDVPSTGYTQEEYDDHYSLGYRQGQYFQKSLLTTTAFTENGVYERENGWKKVTVNIDTDPYYNSGYTDGKAIGYSSGITYQKSLLSAVTITQNGTYTRANGYSAITVDVSDSEYADQYLTIKVLSGGSLYWFASNSAFTRQIEYSKNMGNWTKITSTTTGRLISSVSRGDVIRFRGNNSYYEDVSNNHNYFSEKHTNVKYTVYGNIMSLVYGDNFAGKKTLSSDATFCSLFQGCTGLTSASNLVLPATTLSNRCYMKMFSGCTTLYSSPKLPAKELKNNCYEGMFAGCRKLNTTPILPATTLVPYCYKEMFKGCNDINYIKCLATNISATDCTKNWTQGIEGGGVSGYIKRTFVKAASMSNWTQNTDVTPPCDGIPVNWAIAEE
ncbi:MAG: hypothetical protein IJH39_04070 [Clostridia bacterium]|nr:hypothetical protein [Clostridia bacterium]